MTTKEIRDDFVLKYKIECQKRSTKFLDLGDKAIAKLMSEGIQDLQRRLSIVKATTTIDLDDNTYSYDLPDNFGNVDTVTCGGLLLQIDFKDWQCINTYSDVPSQFSIDGTTIYLDGSSSGNTLTLTYYFDPNFYSNFDTFEGFTFNGSNWFGNTVLPNRYNQAIVYYMLSSFYDDMLMKYEKELNSLKMTQPTNKHSLKYNVAGLRGRFSN